jgi:hypothetical protein
MEDIQTFFLSRNSLSEILQKKQGSSFPAKNPHNIGTGNSKHKI